MSLASDRPPAPSPKTERPYSTLPKQSRSQSGARPKVSDEGASSTSEDLVLEPLAPETQVAADKPRVAPASLKKPFASLAPQPKKESKEISKGTEDSQATTWADTTEARRWNETTEARRRLGTCKKHKITLSPSNECVLCKRETAAQKKGYWIPLALTLIALALVALLVALL